MLAGRVFTIPDAFVLGLLPGVAHRCPPACDPNFCPPPVPQKTRKRGESE
ncbi:hypothetical protein NY78_1795 [Desulfovibrio sp. TomC]|nr:hypothetical protein NY78_1795 [Desulfovibrio sp. TomC]